MSHKRLTNGIDASGHLTAAPELIIEILSPGEKNEQRDKEVKLKLYSRYGVQEYWIVNWRLKTLSVYRRRNGQLQLIGTLLGEDSLTSPLLPEFSMPITRVFA
ncbi:MAG: Uma2 family endonuclease [Phormidesmis sp.]